MTSVQMAKTALLQKKFEEKVKKVIEQFKNECGRMPTCQEICTEIEDLSALAKVEHYVGEMKRRGSITDSSEDNIVISGEEAV